MSPRTPTSRPPAAALWRGLKLNWAGRLPFDQAVAENAAMVARVLAGGPGHLMAFEPAAPVYTLGLRAEGARDRGELLSSLTLCRERDIAVVAADRGGLGTLHLPGQLVLFVALPCKREQIARVVKGLLEAAAELGRRHGLRCEVQTGSQAGVFVPRGGKLASIGLRHADGVLRHGMSLNVQADLELTRDLSLCGSRDRGVENLSDRSGSPPSLEAVAMELASLLELKPNRSF